MAEILFGNEILADVPVLDVGGENQLEFGLVLMLAAQSAIERREVDLAVVADEFQDCLIRAGDVLVLDINDQVTALLPQQGQNPTPNPPAGEDRRVAAGGLPIKIKFGRPPGARAVFKLHRRGSKAVTAAGLATGCLGFAL